MIDHSAIANAQPQMDLARRQFGAPPTNRALNALGDAELSTWLHANGTARVHMRPWSLQGWRWRRALSQASRQFANRVQGSAEAPDDFCMICRSTRATDHRAIGHGASLQTVHYCDNCSAGGQAGWFTVSTK